MGVAGRRTRGWTWTSCWAFRPWSHEVFVKEVVLGVSYWNIGLLAIRLLLDVATWMDGRGV